MTEPYTWVYWVPLLVFETFLVTLVVAKSIQMVHTPGGSPHLFTVLLRDSFVYFGSHVVLILSNLLVWVSGRVSRASLTLHCVLTNDGCQPTLFAVTLASVVVSNTFLQALTRFTQTWVRCGLYLGLPNAG